MSVAMIKTSKFQIQTAGANGMLSRVVRNIFAGSAVLAATGMLAFSPAARAQAPDKSTSVSQAERLHRDRVSRERLGVHLLRRTVVKLKNGLPLVLQEDHKLPPVDFPMWL